MDLDSALHSCRCGGFIRNDSVMAVGWKIKFVPDKTPANLKLPAAQRKGSYFYVNPAPDKEGYEVRFSDKAKASVQWRTEV